MNTITIYKLQEDEQGRRSQGEPVAMFPASANNAAATTLWVFMVENLTPGFFVVLSFDAFSELARPSGAALPAALYERVMS